MLAEIYKIIVFGYILPGIAFACFGIQTFILICDAIEERKSK